MAAIRGSLPWLYSVLVHVIAVGLVVLGFGRPAPALVAPTQIAIKATVVDEGRIRQERERLEAIEKRREQDEQARIRRLEEEAREEREAARRETRRLEQLAEQEREREAAAKAEKIRLAKLEEKRREEAAAEALRQQELVRKRNAEAEARGKREAQRAEEQRLAAIEKEKQDEARRRSEAAAARQIAELEAGLARELAVEQQRMNAERAGLLAQYKTLIRQKVQRNWIRPPGAAAGLECEVRVTQIPGGDVVDVRVGRCNGDAAVVRSIETAVFRAAPLPEPPDPTLFDRNLIFVFKPE